MAAPEIHKIVRFAAAGKNAYNETSFDPAAEITAFWIDKSEKTQDLDGNEFVSHAKILANTDLLAVGDRVQFDEIANADINKSHVVKTRKFVENRNQSTQLYTYLLGIE